MCAVWRGRPAALILALAAILLCGPVSTGQAAEKGIQTDMTWLDGINPATDQPRAAAMVGDLGAKWVRLDASWYQIEDAKGQYDAEWLALTDNAINLAKASGAKIIMMVNETPNWASGSDDKNMPPQNPQDYADYMRYLATRWKGRVDAYEIWNEPNFDRFWTSGPDPAAYTRLLKAAYPAVKSADPNARVLFGGLASNDYAFVEAAYAAAPDLGRYFDVMATHPYSWAEPPEHYWYDGNGRVDPYSFAGYREVRKTMLNHGDDKPLWFTEFGWSTTTQTSDRHGVMGVDEATQADYLRRAFDCVEQDPYVQVATWYTMRNSWWANDADTWEDQLGLVRTDYSKKPAYDAYKAYSPDAGGCDYTLKPGAQEPANKSDVMAKQAPAPATATAPQLSLTVRPASRTLRARRGKRRVVTARRFTLAGTVRNTKGGYLWLQLQRPSKGHWKTVTTLTQQVGAQGTFRRTRTLERGRWRVRALFVDAATHALARSPMRKIIVGRNRSITLRRARARARTG